MNKGKKIMFLNKRKMLRTVEKVMPNKNKNPRIYESDELKWKVTLYHIIINKLIGLGVGRTETNIIN